MKKLYDLDRQIDERNHSERSLKIIKPLSRKPTEINLVLENTKFYRMEKNNVE